MSELPLGDTGPMEPPTRRRGPGRPRKSEAQQAPIEKTVEKEQKAAPRRSADKPTPEKVKEAAAKQLFGAHHFAAMMTGLPELAISEQEAAMLADPLIDTMSLLGLPMDLGKYMAPVSLIVAAGMIYGPRVQMIRAKIAAEQQRQRQAPPSPSPAAGAQTNGAAPPRYEVVGGVAVAMPSEDSPIPLA